MVIPDQMPVSFDYDREATSVLMLGAGSISSAAPQQWNWVQADIRHHNIADSFQEESENTFIPLSVPIIFL